MSAPEPADDPIEVRARGRRFTGWTSVSIQRSIEDAASTFELGLSGKAQANTPIRAGDPVEVWIGADLALSGYAEKIGDKISATSVEVTIGGRSKTCDVVDCSAPLGAWAGKRVRDVLATLIGDIGVDVVDEAGVGGEIMPQLRPQKGETIHDALDRAGRERGFLVTDDERGRLVLTRAGARGKIRQTIDVGAPPVLTAEGAWDVSERFATYEVEGQNVTDAEIDASVFGSATDVGVARARRLTVAPEKPLDTAGARRWARWEAARRAGKSFAGTYTVRGWRDADGAPWRPNTLVDLIHSRANILGVEMLLVSVGLLLTADAGRVATLHLGPRAGYDLPPVQAVDVGDVGEGDAGDDAGNPPTTDPNAGDSGDGAGAGDDGSESADLRSGKWE